jgi:hypothetical protein
VSSEIPDRRKTFRFNFDLESNFHQCFSNSSLSGLTVSRSILLSPRLAEKLHQPSDFGSEFLLHSKEATLTSPRTDIDDMPQTKQTPRRRGKALRRSLRTSRTNELVGSLDQDISDYSNVPSTNPSRSTSLGPQPGTASAQAQTSSLANAPPKKTRPIFT